MRLGEQPDDHLQCRDTRVHHGDPTEFAVDRVGHHRIDGREVTMAAQAPRLLAREFDERRATDVDVHPPTAVAELRSGVVGIVLGDDGAVRLHIRGHPPIGCVVEEGVTPRQLREPAARRRFDDEHAVERPHLLDDLLHNHGSSIIFKCLCGVQP